MSSTTVNVLDFKNQVLIATSKNEVIEIFDHIKKEIGSKVTLGRLASVDEYYYSNLGRNEWENIRQRKAGFLPYKRATLAMIKIAEAG